ncbi:hypothetical protein BaRGS_00027754 [Batillaria attramentaria]|uniref:Uncharacterized protein n=1 Tax=Batillaria attramentaria TaxID=370345 RepID=A0ABD0K242_9CAEN
MFWKCVRSVPTGFRFYARVNADFFCMRTHVTVSVSVASTSKSTANRKPFAAKPHSVCAMMSHVNRSTLQTSTLHRLPAQGGVQSYVTTTTGLMARLKPEEVRKRVEELTDLFAEARELLGDARESVGTTYFSDDMSDAQEAVSNTLAAYEALLSELEKDQKDDVVRTIGLRMEELRAQEQAIKDLLD